MPLRRLLPIAVLAITASPAAYAVDFNTALELWNVVETGPGGNQGNDHGTGVAINSAGEYVVSGYLDGIAGHGRDGFLAKYDVNGTQIWAQQLDAGLIDGVTLFSSDDSYNDVVLDSLDEICVGGTVAGSTSDAWDQVFLTEKRASLDGSLIWDDRFQDSTGSPVQINNAVAVDSADLLYATGWSHRANFINGHWVSFRYLNNTGARDLGPVQYNFAAESPPDEAHDIAVDSLGNIFVVGVISNPVVAGGLDWQVIKYDPDGLVIWTDTYAGASGLDDAAMGIAINNLGQAIVVGHTNVGTNNGNGAINQWLMIRYAENGIGSIGDRMWEVTWESAVDANERATDIALDSFGDAVVAGTWREGGREAWRVAMVSSVDGAVTSDWRWSSSGADTAPISVSIRDSTVAVTGYQWNGTNEDLLLTVLDQDDDGDLLGNSLDGCPTDFLKTEPGDCGCGFADVDTDGDGFLDCDDACPDLTEKFDDEGICGCDESDTDRDGDGTMDCVDNCPDNPDKVTLGVCGCGSPDTDSDGDGVLGCDDACSNTPAGTEVDAAGCPLVDEPTGTATGGTSSGDDKDSGCNSVPGGAGFLAIGLVAALIRRRR